MKISNYIPKGKVNAISRRSLCELTGLPDRTVRDMIHNERREHPILSADTGGYYIPTAEEIGEVERFRARESSRAKSIFWSLQGCKTWLESHREEKEKSDTFLVEATRCRRCGGLLTSEQAVRNGYGHLCAKREEAEREERKNQISLFE